jgi:hypothetical protein
MEVSGRRMLEVMIAGETDAEKIAELGQLKKKREPLIEALRTGAMEIPGRAGGRVGAVEEALCPFAKAVERGKTILRWPRSVPAWSSSPMPNPWPLGPVCVRAIARPRADIGRQDTRWQSLAEASSVPGGMGGLPYAERLLRRLVSPAGGEARQRARDPGERPSELPGSGQRLLGQVERRREVAA